MTAREFAEWIAYNELNPFGLERRDAQAAIVASTVATFGAAAAGVRRRFDPTQFMPRFGAPEPRQRQTANELLDIVRKAQASSSSSGRTAASRRR